jgi:hypothetical protein
MSEPWRPREPKATPRQVVGSAIQALMVARLGRGFVPLALLFVVGVGQIFTEEAAWTAGLALSVGAVATAAAMLAYGLRVVQHAFGRAHRLWMSAAMAASVVPALYAVYVLGWRGLRNIPGGGGAFAVTSAILHVGVGVWVLLSWMKVVELDRLARVMSMNLDGEEGSA